MDRGPFVPKAEQKSAAGDGVRGVEKEHDILALPAQKKADIPSLTQEKE